MSTKETKDEQELQQETVNEEREVRQKPADRLKEILEGNNRLPEELKERIRKFREKLHQVKSDKSEM